MMKKNIILGLVLVFFCGIFTANSLYSQNESSKYKWKKLSGRWKFENSHIIERRRYSGGWYSNEILENNSIISMKSFKEFSSIDLKINLYNPLKNPVGMMVFFAARSSLPAGKGKNYYTDFYAFKLSGAKDGITRVSFIRSDIIDSTAAKAIKRNYRVTELLYKLYKLDFNKDHIMSIKFKENKAVLHIDNEEVLQANVPGSYEGKVGFSSRNISMKVNYYKLSSNETVLFQD